MANFHMCLLLINMLLLPIERKGPRNPGLRNLAARLVDELKSSRYEKSSTEPYSKDLKDEHRTSNDES
jgi:hypothetical protein